MKNKTCCFTGHREIPCDEYNMVYSKTKQEIIKLINSGVRYFGAGGARGYDTLAAEIVLELKEVYPQIRLILILPCFNQTRGWHKFEIEKFESIKQKADKVRVLAKNYYSGCMHARNRHMVDNSNNCICYLRKNVGGTAYTVQYARQKGLNIIKM